MTSEAHTDRTSARYPLLSDFKHVRADSPSRDRTSSLTSPRCAMLFFFWAPKGTRLATAWQRWRSQGGPQNQGAIHPTPRATPARSASDSEIINTHKFAPGRVPCRASAAFRVAPLALYECSLDSIFRDGCSKDPRESSHGYLQKEARLSRNVPSRSDAKAGQSAPLRLGFSSLTASALLINRRDLPGAKLIGSPRGARFRYGGTGCDASVDGRELDRRRPAP
jgi:hypothetical protein